MIRCIGGDIMSFKESDLERLIIDLIFIVNKHLNW